MNKQIETKNSKGQLHGYQQWYGYGHVLVYRGKRKTYMPIEYNEWHMTNNKNTRFFIR